MSVHKYRHAEYTSKSRHHFHNSISKIGGSAARDAYFEHKYRQKSPELGGSAAGAYSGYSDQETESEREDFRCASRRPNETDRHKFRSEHAFHHYKDDSPEESSRYRMIQYQHKESRNSSRCESLSRHRESSHVYKSSCKTTNYHQRPSHMPHRSNTCRNDPSHKRPSAYNDSEHYRSSHKSPSQSSTRKSSLRHDYRWSTPRTPSESPTRESRHSYRSPNERRASKMERANSVRQDHRHQCRGPRSSDRTPLYRSPHKHSWSGTMREEKDHRQRRLNNTCHYSFSYQSRHNESYHSHSRTDKRSSVRHKSRHRSQRQHTRTSSRNQSPPSSGCCSSSDTESSASSSEYSSDDKYSLSYSCYDDRVCSSVISSSPDRRYYNQYDKRHHQHEKHLSPERSYHHQDRQIYQIKSLSMAETNSCKRDNLAEDSLPMHASEDQNENRVRSTRKLKVDAFQQEFRQKFDRIECMARLILSRTRTPPRIGFHRGLFL